ncbi:MAG: hypothetical protein LC725_11745 [Lentisphaerae bacterium]|nr:hypothetical protein [Lentisphaerota bacterium]
MQAEAALFQLSGFTFFQCHIAQVRIIQSRIADRQTGDSIRKLHRYAISAKVSKYFLRRTSTAAKGNRPYERH